MVEILIEHVQGVSQVVFVLELQPPVLSIGPASSSPQESIVWVKVIEYLLEEDLFEVLLNGWVFHEDSTE